MRIEALQEKLNKLLPMSENNAVKKSLNDLLKFAHLDGALSARNPNYIDAPRNDAEAILRGKLLEMEHDKLGRRLRING